MVIYAPTDICKIKNGIIWRNKILSWYIRIYSWRLDSLILSQQDITQCFHDDVIKWKHFPRYCPFVRGIHRSPVNSPHKGQWRGALMLSLICVWINGWVNNREVGDLRRYRAHFDVTVMFLFHISCTSTLCRAMSEYMFKDIPKAQLE